MAKVSKKLLLYAAKLNKNIEKMLDEFCLELAKCNIPFSQLSTEDIFDFKKYPTSDKAAEKVCKKYYEKFLSLMRKSIAGSVTLAMGS